MGRYIGPTCRLCRREGMKLYLKGARCAMSKCAIEAGRSTPGMAGRHPRKPSEYGTQLREKQRLRRHYGMRERQFKFFFKKALRKRGITGEALLQSLEMRLDSVVYRLGLAVSRRAARQFVGHGHVRLNGHRGDIPSLQLRPGNTIAVKTDKRSQAAARQALEATQTRGPAPWLAFDPEHLTGEVLRIPTRDEIAPLVNEQLVVELYSR